MSFVLFTKKPLMIYDPYYMYMYAIEKKKINSIHSDATSMPITCISHVSMYLG